MVPDVPTWDPDALPSPVRVSISMTSKQLEDQPNLGKNETERLAITEEVRRVAEDSSKSKVPPKTVVQLKTMVCVYKCYGYQLLNSE